MKTFTIFCNRPFYNSYKSYPKNANRYAYHEYADTLDAAKAIAEKFQFLGYSEIEIFCCGVKVNF